MSDRLQIILKAKSASVDPILVDRVYRTKELQRELIEKLQKEETRIRGIVANVLKTQAQRKKIPRKASIIPAGLLATNDEIEHFSRQRKAQRTLDLRKHRGLTMQIDGIATPNETGPAARRSSRAPKIELAAPTTPVASTSKATIPARGEARQRCPIFLPSPTYAHVDNFTRSVVDNSPSLISSFPVTAQWENDYACRRLYLELMEDLERHLNGIKNFRGDTKIEQAIDTAAFKDVDIGRVYRDFAGISHVFNLCSGFDLASAAKTFLPSYNRADEDEECVLIDDMLEFAPKVMSVKTLEKIFRMIESVLGRSVVEVLELWRDAVVDRRPRPAGIKVLCAICSAKDCRVHPYSLHRPTSLASATTTSSGHAKAVREEAKPCHPTDCYKLPAQRHLGKVKFEPQEEEDVISCLRERPHADSCTIAQILGRPCYAVHQLQPLSLQTPSFPISRSLKTPKSFMLPGEKDAYRPCHHPNQIDCVPCNPKCEYTLTDVNPELVCDDPKHCHCVERGNWCDVNCDCSPDCARRWKGCNCFEGCDSSCPCYENQRECDINVCGCRLLHDDSDLGREECQNCKLQRQLQKACVMALSKIPHAGFGLFLAEDAKAGDLIGDYGGEHFEADNIAGAKRSAVADIGGVSYWFDVDGKTPLRHAIDSVSMGNRMRLINGVRSAEDSNCVSRVMYVAGVHHVVIYATKSLVSGSELLLHYGDNYPLPGGDDGLSD